MTGAIPIVLVAVGGAIGAVSRYLLAGRVTQWLGLAFPYGTLAVNLLGCFFMGVLIGLFARYANEAQTLRLFLAVGVLGGFTTFSAFSLEIVTLLENKDTLKALIYVFVSVVGCILGLFAGLYAVRLLAS